MEGRLFSDVFLPFALGIIMLGMGLSLDLRDFGNIFKNPKALITGLMAQMILLPGISFFLAWILNLEPAFAVGLVLIAACPGGASSNLISHLLKANVALSISLTTLNSFITLVTIPLIVNLGLLAFMDHTTSLSLPIANTILQVFLITLLPTAIGILIRRRFPQIAANLENPLRIILPILLAIAFGGVMLFDQSENKVPLLDYLPLIIPTLLLNILGVLAGFLSGQITGLSRENKLTIGIEVGLQNSALAIFIASTLIQNSQMAVIAVIYGSFSFFSTIAMVLFLNWITRIFQNQKSKA